VVNHELAPVINIQVSVLISTNQSFFSQAQLKDNQSLTGINFYRYVNNFTLRFAINSHVPTDYRIGAKTQYLNFSDTIP
jgi:hypothetical protein